MASAVRQSLQTRDSQTQSRRSSGVNLGRFLAKRRSTPIWWRRARFSHSRAARERKTEDRVASNVARKMSIGGVNDERSIDPYPLTQFRVFERHTTKHSFKTH